MSVQRSNSSARPASRLVVPRRAFTLNQRTQPPSHFLLLFETANASQIAYRSSVKQTDGDTVSLLIRNKLVEAKAVFHGK